MYFGGEIQEGGALKGWAEFDQKVWLEKSLFSLRQDTRLLESNIARLGTKRLAESLERHHVAIDSIDWYLPHISSEFFRSKVDDEMKKNNISVPMEKWFINLARIGNIGSASILLALEELFNSGKLKKGDLFIHESIIGSKFIGTIEEELTVAGKPSIRPGIEGWAKIYGYNTISIDKDDDPYAYGFQVE